MAKQITHDIHAGHQRPLNHFKRSAAAGQHLLVCLFGIGGDEVGDAVNHGMAQALRHANRSLGTAAPLEFAALVTRCPPGRFCDLHQPLASVCPAVKHHVFNPLAQFGRELVIDPNHAGVDDAHVHASLDGMVEKHGVDRLANRIIAPEAEAHIRDPTRHLGARQVLLDPACGLDEVDRIVVVFFDAGGDGEDIGIKNNVFWGEVEFLHQYPVGALADLDLAGVGVGLAFFVKGHHHRCGAIAAQQPGLLFEAVYPLFHADRVDHRLALHAAQASLNHAPLAGVNHDGHPRDVGFAGNQVQKAHHGGLAVEHRLVHVDVDDLGAVLHLLARHRQRLLVLAIQNHAGKGLGASHIGALANVHKSGTRGLARRVIGAWHCANQQRLEAGQLHRGTNQFRHAAHL